MQDAQLISQAGLVESLASDGLVSVSTGAGQPQKNMELAKFADSLGSSVPLQQTSEQVSITGLYARTSDGKMVELTKESVASVVSGLIGFDNVAIPQGRLEQKDFFNNSLNFRQNGMYLFNASNITDESSPVTSSSLWVIENKELYGDSEYLVQSLYSVGQSVCYIRFVTDTSFGSWKRIDNFGYNTLAELSSGVAEQMGILSSEVRGVNITNTVYLLNTFTSKFKSMVVGKCILKDSNGNLSEKNFTENVDSAGYFGVRFQEGINAGSFVLLIYGGY